MSKTRLVCVTVLAVGAGTTAFVLWWLWSRKPKHRPPTKWRKVGELSDLVVFPVKSFGPIREDSMECTMLGLKSGWLRDRTLAVIGIDGRCVTARQYSRMVKIFPSVVGSVLTLQASGTMSISIDLAKICNKNSRAKVWGEWVAVRDCGEEVACWVSRVLLEKDVGLRLVYYPLDRATRKVQTNYKVFPLTESIDTGAFPDATSYMMMNEASVVDLNTRLEEPVTTQWFRPNFVVRGAQPLDEDHWDWVKIGQTVFRNVMPCTRCMVTIVNPETGEKYPNMEPLVTLRKYRLIEDPKLRRHTGLSPAMGIHLALKGPNGIVRLGDSVYVGVPEKDSASLTALTTQL